MPRPACRAMFRVSDRNEAEGVALAKRTVFQRVDNKWGWRLEANGNIIATDGGQGYENEDDARTMADRVVGGYYSTAEKFRHPR
ncbi:DUF1508 domain-containing protein [Herbiconiux sp. P17]|uniref:DUF1508 domain-containing protein n=1 Tax=Herbiconiux wuyangfengii TaxID=3342794 RepID=UPI0035B6D059